MASRVLWRTTVLGAAYRVFLALLVRTTMLEEPPCNTQVTAHNAPFRSRASMGPLPRPHARLATSVQLARDTQRRTPALLGPTTQGQMPILLTTAPTARRVHIVLEDKEVSQVRVHLDIIVLPTLSMRRSSPAPLEHIRLPRA